MQVRTRVARCWAAVAVAAAIGWSSAARAKGPLDLLGKEAVTATPAVVSAEAIGARRGEVAAEIDRLRAERASAPQEAQPYLDDETELLERISLRYGQQLAAMEEVDALQAARERGKQELQTLREQGMKEKPPYSLIALDEASDDLDAQVRRGETLEASVEAAEASLDQANVLYAQREAERRQAKEAAEAASEPAAAPAAQKALRLSQLRSRAAAELVALRLLELKRERLARQVQKSHTTLLNERVATMAAAVRFTSDELAETNKGIESRAARLDQDVAKLQPELDKAEARWSRDRERLERAGAPDAALQQQVDSSRETYQTLQRELAVVEQRRQRLDDLKEVWRRRFAIVNGAADAATTSAWRRDAQPALEQLDREARVQQARLLDLRKEALALGARIADAAESGQDVRALRAQQQSLQNLIDTSEANLTSLQVTQRQYQRLLREIQSRIGSRSLGERVSALWAAAGVAWRYELTSIDDHSVTAGKVFIALVLLVVGLRFAGVLSRYFGHRVLPRLGVPSGAATAFESITYYLAVVAVVLFALRAVNIPLTAFTIIGGALAIGLGFGSQNIVNNFISGLILLVERPISVGDLVEIEGVLGSVEAIGARSTRVRTFENTHVLVPNSFFLENKVLNWTLSDHIVRGCVVVGVAYGSPTREVARLLLQAAGEHRNVVGWPEPIVRFKDFGDNALLFHVYFWIQPLEEIWSTESDVRFRVDELFRGAGITISFPQRDVHLDTLKPLDVRLVPASPSEAPTKRRDDA